MQKTHKTFWYRKQGHPTPGTLSNQLTVTSGTSQNHESVRFLLLERCRARQGTNPARTGSMRSGIFGSQRITKNISGPYFWFSGNMEKMSFEANLALFGPAEAPQASMEVFRHPAGMHNGWT